MICPMDGSLSIRMRRRGKASRGDDDVVAVVAVVAAALAEEALEVLGRVLAALVLAALVLVLPRSDDWVGSFGALLILILLLPCLPLMPFFCRAAVLVAVAVAVAAAPLLLLLLLLPLVPPPLSLLLAALLLAVAQLPTPGWRGWEAATSARDERAVAASIRWNRPLLVSHAVLHGLALLAVAVLLLLLLLLLPLLSWPGGCCSEAKAGAGAETAAADDEGGGDESAIIISAFSPMRSFLRIYLICPNVVATAALRPSGDVDMCVCVCVCVCVFSGCKWWNCPGYSLLPPGADGTASEERGEAE